MQELNDEPLSAIDGDSFGISEYHQALAGFIQRCATPISIGVQGKSGSGKTSFLHTVEQLLDSSNHKIWINAWEHSLFCNPEQSLMAIITAISDEIASLSRSSKTIKEIKKASSTVMSSAAKIGAGLVAGRAGLQVVNDLQSKGPSIRELRRILELSINETLIKDNKKRFVFFIDDISRINPKTAVKVLELLKNIFHLPNCVFVLSIDYETIQRGLVDLFGEPSGDNDHEFRAFYEKIIQVPFLMPTEEHDSVDYTADILVKAGYLESEKITEKDKEDLHHLVYNSISGNPRGLKRLINSLILIMPLIEDMEKTSDRLIIFAIVCLQVSCRLLTVPCTVRLNSFIGMKSVLPGSPARPWTMMTRVFCQCLNMKKSLMRNGRKPCLPLYGSIKVYGPEFFRPHAS